MVQLLSYRPKLRQVCPPHPCRACCFRLVKHKHFDMYILLAILFNTALMALDGYGISAQQKRTLDALNNVCTTVFIFECSFKLAAFGCSGYFSEAWNIFDFSVVLVSVVVCCVTLEFSALLLLDFMSPSLSPTAHYSSTVPRHHRYRTWQSRYSQRGSIPIRPSCASCACFASLASCARSA